MSLVHMFICRWSREQAFHYGRGKTAQSRKELAPIINRVITLPGQSVSAGYGCYKIHNLRYKAFRRLGEFSDSVVDHNLRENGTAVYVIATDAFRSISVSDPHYSHYSEMSE